MKKVIDLGNNIKVEFENDEYKIISANGSIIRLDDEGEFLGCENTVGQKLANKRKNYLRRFIKIGEEERESIINWMDVDLPEEIYKKHEKFFVGLRKAVDEIKYDFYVALLFNTHQKIELLSDYRRILPKYEAIKADSNEMNIFIGYNLMMKDWAYEDIFEGDNFMMSFIVAMEKLYVLKLEE